MEGRVESHQWAVAVLGETATAKTLVVEVSGEVVSLVVFLPVALVFQSRCQR